MYKRAALILSRMQATARPPTSDGPVAASPRTYELREVVRSYPAVCLKRALRDTLRRGFFPPSLVRLIKTEDCARENCPSRLRAGPARREAMRNDRTYVCARYKDAILCTTCKAFFRQYFRSCNIFIYARPLRVSFQLYFSTNTKFRLVSFISAKVRRSVRSLL